MTRMKSLEDEAARRTLVDELVKARLDSGMRQIDVANILGVAQPSVSELESGRTSPKLETLQKYARAVGMKIEFEVETTNDENDS